MQKKFIGSKHAPLMVGKYRGVDFHNNRIIITIKEIIGNEVIYTCSNWPSGRSNGKC